MRERRASRVLAAMTLAIMTVLAGSCSGGGGGGSTVTTAPPPPPPALQITTTALPNGVQGEAYSETFHATGGKAPYMWSAAAALPFGLSLSSSGVLSGTLQGAGGGICEIRVTDSSSPPRVLGQTYIFESEQALTLPPNSFGDPNVGRGYSTSINSTGGSSPFTWSLLSGAASLPPGLSFGGSTYQATLSGIPTGAGTFNFTIQVSEVNPPYQKAQQSFFLTFHQYSGDYHLVPAGRSDQQTLSGDLAGHRRNSALSVERQFRCIAVWIEPGPGHGNHQRNADRDRELWRGFHGHRFRQSAAVGHALAKHSHQFGLAFHADKLAEWGGRSDLH
jgi:Putative Ig domain